MTPADHVQNDHAAANRTLRQRLVIGLISFLTLVDLFGAQALLPSLTIADDVDPGTMGLAWAYPSNLTVDEMSERPFYHPWSKKAREQPCAC